MKLEFKGSERMILRSFVGKVAGFALALLAGVSLSCHPGTPNKILFLGIDALDWEMIDTLRDQGLLPNIDRLIKTGCSAKIETNEWGAGSALYWTDIATGQFSKKHGINDFVYTDPQTGKMTPNTSNRRKTKAFWNIFSEKGVSVGVVGWYITWPVENVRGFMVSSYFTYKDVQPTIRGMYYAQEPDMIYPRALADETKDYVHKGETQYQQRIRKIIPLEAPTTSQPTVTKAEWAIMSDSIYLEVGRHLYEKMKPEVFAVYLGSIDTVGHMFTHKNRKRKAKAPGKFADVQKNCYLAMDEMIAPIVSSIDDKTFVFLVSDHGLMRGKHQKNGVFVLSGPGVKRGVRLEKPVALIDICPTMLYLMGLPVAEDMDGRVCLEAMTPEHVAAHRIQTIASYGPRRDSSDKPIETNFDESIIKRLKTLGYLK